MRRLSLPLLATAAVAAAGCGASSGHRTPPAGDLVVVRTGNALVALAPADKGLRRVLPSGQLAPGARTRVYAAAAAGGSTRVTATDPATGAVVASRQLSGTWVLPITTVGGAPDGLAPDGRAVVLQAVGAAGSRFAILDPNLSGPVHTVSLPKGFAYDTVAPDASLLYLIQARRSAGAGHYSVRVYDLKGDRLQPGVVVAKSEDVETSMSGEPTARTATADGTWVFTLYRNAAKGPFLHALSTGDGVALCTDLPREARSSDAVAHAWGLALAPSEETVYAVNPVLGLVVEITPKSGEIQRVTRIPKTPAAGGASSPVVSRDGQWLYVPSGSGIVVIDTATFVARAGRLLSGTPIRSLALSPDGRRLYATTSTGTLIAISLADGHVMSRSSARDAVAIAGVARA